MRPETHHTPTIRVERRDNLAVLVPSPGVATAVEDTLDRAGRAALDPLRTDPPKNVVMDLSQLGYFGSLFLAFLIRCHTLAKRQGGRLVVVGASVRVRDLLHLTALDTLWDFYPDQAQAFQALGSAA